MKDKIIKRIDLLKREVGKRLCKHRMVYVITGIMIMLCIIAGILTHYKQVYETTYFEYDLTDEGEIEKNTKRAKKTNYVGETVFDGAAVPYVLYDIPFITDEDKNIISGADDSYYTNKDLVARMGEDTIQLYVDKATSYMNLTMGNNYRDILADTGSFIEEYKAAHDKTYQITTEAMAKTEDANEDGYVDIESLANAVVEMYVDNSLTLDTTFYCDKSLVYFKYYRYFVRGMLTVTPTSTEHKKGEPCKPLKDLYNIDVNYGETVNLVVDICINPDTDMGISTMTFSEIVQ